MRDGVLQHCSAVNVPFIGLAARLSEIGGVVMPPVPAFYTRPETIADIVDDTVGRVLQRLGLPLPGLGEEWPGDVLRD